MLERVALARRSEKWRAAKTLSGRCLWRMGVNASVCRQGWAARVAPRSSCPMRQRSIRPRSRSCSWDPAGGSGSDDACCRCGLPDAALGRRSETDWRRAREEQADRPLLHPQGGRRTRVLSTGTRGRCRSSSSIVHPIPDSWESRWRRALCAPAREVRSADPGDCGLHTQST